jgi:hypothetical protein
MNQNASYVSIGDIGDEKKNKNLKRKKKMNRNGFNVSIKENLQKKKFIKKR